MLLRSPKTWIAHYDMKHELLYCPIPRCASTAWMQFLLYINGELLDPSLHIPLIRGGSIDQIYGQKAIAMTKDLSSYMTISDQKADRKPLISFLFVR